MLLCFLGCGLAYCVKKRLHACVVFSNGDWVRDGAIGENGLSLFCTLAWK